MAWVCSGDRSDRACAQSTAQNHLSRARSGRRALRPFRCRSCVLDPERPRRDGRAVAPGLGLVPLAPGWDARRASSLPLSSSFAGKLASARCSPKGPRRPAWPSQPRGPPCPGLSAWASRRRREGPGTPLGSGSPPRSFCSVGPVVVPSKRPVLFVGKSLVSNLFGGDVQAGDLVLTACNVGDLHSSWSQQKTCSKFRGDLGEAGRAIRFGCACGLEFGGELGASLRVSLRLTKRCPERVSLEACHLRTSAPAPLAGTETSWSSRVSHHAQNVASIPCSVSVYVSSWGPAELGLLGLRLAQRVVPTCAVQTTSLLITVADIDE